MKHHLRIVSILLLCILIFGMVGCGKSTESAQNGNVTQVGKIGGSDRSSQEYIWISQYSNLPLFVERVYPALDRFAADYGVTVRKAGPTTVDLAAYIATVEQEAARKPAGIIVVGGWDPAMTESVNKAIAMKVPVVVTDGDLFNSDRLCYVGTDWYNLGVRMAEYQIAEHEKRGLTSGEIAILSPIQNENMQAARQGIKDTLADTNIRVVAEEDNESQADIAAQKVSALLKSYRDLTGLVGLDSEAGPGIIAALDEAGMTGKVIVTCNEAGKEFLNNIKEDKISMITMERYDVMNYIALQLLYAWNNNAVPMEGMDPWTNNWMPNKIDSGLLIVTKDNVDAVINWMTESEKLSAEQ
jgi:ribose transport system substrate-binding protein